ncbi:uncharacterized protein LOC109842036 [Asparagus officinalis]|uniref:uncharacterized protein LOC109842036 n=1 Tax=Asparagus officinalis TaxID=4686 RepID=UPI00098E03EB|nr:uncharacterized protein LOC109842036 [Asparagus officinalis]
MMPDVLEKGRASCYRAADMKPAEIATVSLLYPADCKKLRAQFVNQHRPTWVKQFDRQYCRKKRVMRLLDDEGSRREMELRSGFRQQTDWRSTATVDRVESIDQIRWIPQRVEVDATPHRVELIPHTPSHFALVGILAEVTQFGDQIIQDADDELVDPSAAGGYSLDTAIVSP